jgi:hypothetical protein
LAANLHPYRLYDEEDGRTSYVFTSSNGSVYSVSFNSNEYDKYTELYPHLFTYGYSFGFFRMTKPVNRVKEDELIFSTIEAIVIDFCNKIGNEIVLLYHCDYKDGRQSFRDKLFRDKFEASLNRDGFKRDRYELYIPEKDESHYMGYITPVSNPKIDLVQLEFDACSFNLMQDKIQSPE